MTEPGFADLTAAMRLSLQPTASITTSIVSSLIPPSCVESTTIPISAFSAVLRRNLFVSAMLTSLQPNAFNDNAEPRPTAPAPITSPFVSDNGRWE